ncbi:putative glycogen phosphorylase [Serendipita vermifera]|nr:putative glycogen phosphorylase [Serendipita vermifera]
MSHSFDTKAIGKPRAHKRTATGYLPEVDDQGQEKWPKGDEQTWKAGMRDVDRDVNEISKNIVHHIQTSLARQAYNIDNVGAYQATALAAREDLIVNWNKTQLTYTKKTPKRAYYLSLEFLMGRTLDNALLNLGLKEKFSEGLDKLGFNMEDILDAERDAALGNGGLGRLAACYVDSGATCELPLWGYGLRYHYGMFQQLIASDGSQLEAPDPWLENSNPWEIPRLDVTVDVRFGGYAEKLENRRGIWSGGQEVLAVAYDVPIPGSDTKTTNNIRFWSAKPRRGFDLQSFNAGDYERSVESSNSAANITNVLYPNDTGKALRLQQQYFWCAASLSDIMRRFKNTGQPISEFPNHVVIQLNDTHPTLAIPELMRILVDEEEVEWDDAWKIVTKTFAFTNHTVLPEALEKWPFSLFEQLLPRHLQIILDINWDFLQDVAKKFRGDMNKLAKLSLIEEHPKQIRMANLAVVGSFKVNGVAELHSELVRTTILKDFVDYYGVEKFRNVTNGITPRRWLDQCNPALSTLITETLGSRAWVKDLNLLKGLLKHDCDSTFQKKWAAAKANNKERLARYIKNTLGITVDTTALFDIQEYKRQSMNILGVIHRYLTIKAMSPEDRAKVNARVILFAGKAAPGYWMAKLIIRLIVNVGKVVNNDPDVKGKLTVLFLPDYSVSLAELLIPASDISEHISTAGTEASGTSNMKFCLNGGLLLGTVDGANIEIAQEVGEDNVFFFGHLTPAVEELRYQHRYHPVPVEEKSPALAAVLNDIMSGRYGDGSIWEPFVNTVRQGDHYLISDDFDSYLQAQKMVDDAYIDDPQGWIKKSIHTSAKMGKFSSDRAIMTYADEIWNIEPVKV